MSFKKQLRVPSSEFRVQRSNPKRILLTGLCLVVLLIPCRAQAADRLYYFWSFSMPEESVQAALSDGEKIGLVAVLRGLPEGSAKDSLIRLKRLIGERKIEVIIDPLLSRLYEIKAVPVLVYAEGVNRSCENCKPVPKHWKIAGDVPLRTALKTLARSTPSVERYLKKLREGFFQE
ncbi:MAG: type-F conjugative transfer system pilin assembly protein TrbC [Nitrospiria bacterium]